MSISYYRKTRRLALAGAALAGLAPSLLPGAAEARSVCGPAGQNVYDSSGKVIDCFIPSQGNRLFTPKNPGRLGCDEFAAMQRNEKEAEKMGGRIFKPNSPRAQAYRAGLARCGL